ISIIFVVMCAAVVACGSGTTTTINGGVTPTTASPGPNATAAATAAATMSAGGSAVGLILGPATGSGVSGVTVAFGSTSTSGFVVIGAWNALPPRTPVLTAAVGPMPTPLAYITITPSVSATFNTTPSLIVNLGTSTSTTNTSYYVAYLPPGASSWQQPLLGPATLNTATQLNLPPNLNAGAWAVQANATYTYAIYAIPTPHFTDDWTTYAHDAQRTGFEQYTNASSALGKITPQNASSLQLAWSNAPNPNCDTQATTAAVVADEASVLVANGLVYYADTCGYIAALNRETGAVVWHYQAAVPNVVDGVLGTPVIDGTTLIAPIWGDPGSCTQATLLTCNRAQGGYLVALNATTGALDWQTAPLALGNMRGEPFVLNGQIYQGVSGGDLSTGWVNGGIIVYNETTGGQIGSIVEIAPPTSIYGSYDGGSSWTPITYDGTNLLIGTGNTRGNDGLQDGVLQLIPQTGAAPLVSSSYVISTYDATDNDEDVGGGIMLYGGNIYFTAKNGYYYSFSTASSNAALVKTLINGSATPGGRGGIGTPTTDGAIVAASDGYDTCTSPGVCTESDLKCFQLGGSTPFAKLEATNSAIYSYPAFAPGVGFIGIDNGATDGVPTGGTPVLPEFIAFDDTCHVIWKANPLLVKGFFYGGPAVVPSGVYAVDNAGNVYAWKLPYQMGIASSLPIARRMHQTPFTLLRSTHYLKTSAGRPRD
ncbi:MAG TPA: PQQ-binding-like beta-propeller repeat protein, partial [Candidatus Baltobacteraceae bacterium]|nr:PQQ-binding-like beta-propeller repeat protein [Candidatus Baltobacteraceae bacterium]